MRSPLSVPTLSSTRRPSRSSGRSGPACRRGPARCGGCCPRNSPGRALRTATPNWMRGGAVTEGLPSPGTTAVRVLRDLMNRRVAVTTPDTVVAAAAADMVEENVGSAVVMQGPFVAGILTERDVLRAAASGEDLSASLVSPWMTPDPQSVSPDTSVEDAAQIMLLNGFRHLPVVEGRLVCGVGSLRALSAARIRRPLPG